MQNDISFSEFLNKVIDASVAKMWTLYGFMKNLPDKNSTVDTFLDYSISVYHEELLRILRRLKVNKSLDISQFWYLNYGSGLF